MIAAMTIGTAVSLFVIPLIYIKIEEGRHALSINENNGMN
jgi:hypothetical protein